MNIGTSVTQQIVDGTIEIKQSDKNLLKEGFKDYLDSIDTNDGEIDLEQELAKDINFDDFSTFEQRHKDVFVQPRLKTKLKPISYSLLPYVTKSCKETEKYVIKPKISRISNEDGFFEMDNMLMKNFPTITIKAIDAKETTE